MLCASRLVGLLALVASLATAACRLPAVPLTSPATPPAAPANTAPAIAAPVLILLSLDGWRWDYHTLTAAPNLAALMARGVRAEGLIPVYPTKTFPNHYSIVTGLYPEHHGIVGNRMLDPATGLRFGLSDRAAVGDGRWWGGEPIWVTAQRQGRRTATVFWPGSEAPIAGVRPDIWLPYDEGLTGTARVSQILAWLDLPPDRRPSFIAGYFDATDAAGHHDGPASAALREAVARVDRSIGRLIKGLTTRKMLDRVNVVVVSDHGMAPIAKTRVIVLADYVDPATLDIVELDAYLALNPRAGDAAAIYRRLVAAHPRLHVYQRHDTPAHWHFRQHPRIPAIVGVADEGWTIVRDRSAIARVLRNRGNHGFDPRAQSMQGLMVAAGPAFRRGVVVPAFENVHVYNALAAALGVTPAANDGDPSMARRLLAAR